MTNSISWTQLGSDITGDVLSDWASKSSISVSESGHIIAIGSEKANANGIDSGQVSIYKYSVETNSWNQLGKVINGETAGDFFGSSLSLSHDGEYLAVGAPKNQKTGQVKIYRYSNDNWEQIGTSIYGESNEDLFGSSVSISENGSIIAIGGQLNDGNGINSGHVRVFQNSENNWIQIGKDIDGEFSGDLSGSTVSISGDGDLIAIGGRKNDGINGVDSGHVRIFHYDSDNLLWKQLGNDIDGGSGGDLFGHYVSISSDGRSVAIGSPVTNSYKGETKVYSYDDKTSLWNPLGQSIQGESYDSWSGYTVGLSGDGKSLIIGDYSTTSWATGNGAKARIFTFDENNSLWSQQGQTLGGNGYSLGFSDDGSFVGIIDGGTLKLYKNGEKPPQISGPSGDPGNVKSYEHLNENNSSVFQFKSNESSTWSLTGGEDKDLFELDKNNGNLIFTTSPDYENPLDFSGDNIYKVEITSTDLIGNSSKQEVDITVLNVVEINDPDSNHIIYHNENISEVHKFSADIEAVWSLKGGDDISKFLIGENSGILSFIDSPDWEKPSDFDEDNKYEVIISAKDSSNNESDLTIAINIVDVDDTPPLIYGPSGSIIDENDFISVDENSIRFLEFSSSEPVNWSLYNGDDDSFFEIDKEKGILNFKNPPDFENPEDLNKDNIYKVGIRATDLAGNISDQLLDIYVINSIEIGDSSYENNQLFIYENSTYVHKFIADQEVTWTLGNYKDENLFTIDNKNGELKFNSPPDYENPNDENSDGIYNLEIIAINKNKISANQIFDVNVLDIDEPLFSVSSGFSGTIKEGQEIDALISTTFIPANTNLFWAINGSNINSNDVLNGKLNGEFKLDINGTANLALNFLDDNVVEGTEIAELHIFSDEKMNTRIQGSAFLSIMDLPVTKKVADPKTGEIFTYESENLYSLPYFCDFQGLLQAGFDNKESISSYKFHKELDIDGDGIKEAIFTNRISGRWASASVDPLTGEIDFTKYGSDGVTRIVGRYDDPLVPDFGSSNFYLEDGVTLSPVSSKDDPNRFVDLNNNSIFEDNEDRFKLNSQIRLNNDLAIDNLIPKKAGDFDGDGFQEIYWKTYDETSYMRTVMHADGNIQYANYQSEDQMKEYLTTNGNIDSINEII